MRHADFVSVVHPMIWMHRQLSPSAIATWWSSFSVWPFLFSRNKPLIV